jgi:hypothetical protein
MTNLFHIYQLQPILQWRRPLTDSASTLVLAVERVSELPANAIAPFTGIIVHRFSTHGSALPFS